MNLRPAVPADVPAILAMIHELAAFERLAHESVGTPDALHAHLFGDRPAAEVLIGELEGEVQGFALFFPSYSTFLTAPGLYLEDLYVRPAARGAGLGKALLARLAAIAVERGYGRFEWSVLTWNEKAIDFYEAHGARPVDGWLKYRVAGEALDALAAYS